MVLVYLSRMFGKITEIMCAHYFEFKNAMHRLNVIYCCLFDFTARVSFENWKEGCGGGIRSEALDSCCQ